MNEETYRNIQILSTVAKSGPFLGIGITKNFIWQLDFPFFAQETTFMNFASQTKLLTTWP